MANGRLVSASHRTFVHSVSLKPAPTPNQNVTPAAMTSILRALRSSKDEPAAAARAGWHPRSAWWAAAASALRRLDGWAARARRRGASDRRGAGAVLRHPTLLPAEQAPRRAPARAVASAGRC
eukprot:scaffold123238_cov24-Tisochrysis_lutea.AAC.1